MARITTKSRMEPTGFRKDIKVYEDVRGLYWKSMLQVYVASLSAGLVNSPDGIGKEVAGVEEHFHSAETGFNGESSDV